MTGASSADLSWQAHDARIERKYFVPSANLAWAQYMLLHCCRPDPVFPKGLVQSLYYDTADLDLFYESADGSRLRRKVRLRWYDRPAGDLATAFLEIKSKHGLAGTKSRLELKIDASGLQPRRLAAGPLPYDRLCQMLCELGFSPAKRLCPTVMIQYHRCRFVEVMTGLRVCLDRCIWSKLVRKDLGGLAPGTLVSQLSGAVLEAKGRHVDLPPTLAWLKDIRLDWSRYSKYATCLEAHMSLPGQIGRSMPSGILQMI